MGANQSHYERSQLLGVEDGHLSWNFFFTLFPKNPRGFDPEAPSEIPDLVGQAEEPPRFSPCMMSRMLTVGP